MCVKTSNLSGMHERLRKASVLTVIVMMREFQKTGKTALQLDTPFPCRALPPAERQEHRGGAIRLLVKTPHPHHPGRWALPFQDSPLPLLWASLDAFMHLVLLLFSLGA